MKNNVDVSRHQLSRGLNFLARKIVEKELSREMISSEIERSFSGTSTMDRENLITEVINRSYRYAWSLTSDPALRGKPAVRKDPAPVERFQLLGEVLHDCFACSMVKHLVEALKRKKPKVASDGSLGEEFYHHCVKSLFKSGLYPDIDDPELLLIYLKQTMVLLKKTRLVNIKDGKLEVSSGSLPLQDIFRELLTSFWDKTRWEDIFPSNPAASRDLRECRDILVDLIAREKGAFRIDAVANEFFSLTGFSGQNDLYMISFLDFYFFTWMSHFGILGYRKNKKGAAVHMEITPRGRTLIAILQNLR